MPSNNFYRPQRSLYDNLSTKVLTLTNFAWFLAGLLVLILVTLLVKGVGKIGSNEYPYTIQSINSITLDQKLRDTRTIGSLVFLYDSKCTNCPKEMDSLLNLRSLEESGKLALHFISMDADPLDTMTFLEQRKVPESMITYYVPPEGRTAIAATLEDHGVVKVNFDFPHTMLFNNDGKLIVEYRGYVRSQEISRTLQLYQLKSRF